MPTNNGMAATRNQVKAIGKLNGIFGE